MVQGLDVPMSCSISLWVNARNAQYSSGAHKRCSNDQPCINNYATSLKSFTVIISKTFLYLVLKV